MFLKDKKGQSALEYLMTYGWALIVVVIVIGALYVLSTQGQQSSCTPSFGNLTITNHKLDGTGLQVQIQNGTGQTITQVNLAGTLITGTGSLTSDANTASVASGATFIKTLTGSISGNIRANLTLTYNDGTFTQTGTATCTGKV